MISCGDRLSFAAISARMRCSAGLLEYSRWWLSMTTDMTDELAEPIASNTDEGAPDPAEKTPAAVSERVEKKIAEKNNSFLDFVKDADPEALERFMPAPTHRREVPKVGRNEPCVCGSGKKYKKCCG